MFKPIFQVCTVALIALTMTGCWLDSRSEKPAPTQPTQPTPPATPTPPPPAPAPPSFAVGGTATGITGTGLTLATGSTTVVVDANGQFTLLSGLSDDTPYAVSITKQPSAPHQYCTVSNGAGTATTDVSDIQVSCVAAVKMAAQVTDAPIAYASVSVKVGDKVFTTVADANGMFSLNIPVIAEDAAKMVIAESTGAEGQAHVTFANILGTLSAVADGANDDGEIVGTENAGVNITNVSTAKYVLVVQANNGAVPTTGAALQTAERSVDATSVMNLAAAIKLIVDDPDNYSLPAGSSSILAFAADPVAVKTFIDATPTAALEQALTEILADTSLVPGYKTADVPGVYFTIPAAKPGFLSPQGSGLVFNEDGSGEFLTSGSGGFPVTETFAWEVIDGIVKVIYDNPVTTTGVVALADTAATDAQRTAIGNCMGIFQINAKFTVAEREYSLLSAGSLVDQVRVTTLTTTTYDPINVDVGCDASGVVQIASPEPTVQESTTEVWKESELPAQPFTTDEVVGNEWGIYMLVPVGPYLGNAEPTVQFANMLVEFFDGGLAHVDGGDDPGMDIAWEINEHGDLQLTYGDWTQELTKLQVSGDAVKTVMLFQSTVNTQRFAYFDLAVRKNDALLANGAQALWLNEAGQFWHAFTNGWFPGAWDGDEAVFGGGAMTFGWSFLAEGEAWNHQFFYEPYDYANGFVNDGIQRKSAWHREMVWEMDEASEQDGWIGFYGPYINDCYPSTICYRRDWLPLGVNEAGYLYVQEQVRRTPDNGATWGLWIAPRVTPVRAVAFPETEQEGTSHFEPLVP